MRDLQAKLDLIELFDEILSKPKDELSPEEVFQIHLYQEANKLNKTLEIIFNSVSITDRLSALYNEFSASEQSALSQE